MKEKIVVSLSGWAEADPKKVKFQRLVPGPKSTYLISGEEYLKLSESQREDYIIYCAADAFINPIRGEYDYVEVDIVKDEPVKYKYTGPLSAEDTYVEVCESGYWRLPSAIREFYERK